MNELFIAALISYLFAVACAVAYFDTAWRSRTTKSLDHIRDYSYRAMNHRYESYLFLFLVFAIWLFFIIAGNSAP